MELKKIINLILLTAMLLLVALPVTAHETDVLSFGRISVTMPDITVEVKGSGYDQSGIYATLDSEKLSVIDVAEYNSSNNTTCAYILVDLSTSMDGYFDLVQKNIVTYIEGMNEDDKLVLITFGETKVETVLTGDEDRDTAIEVVEELKCDEGGTLFYEGLSKAYQLSNSSVSEFDREYVIAFSDGIDLQKGNTTFDEVLAQYDSRALPLYAACSFNASKSSADRFGEIARASGGIFSFVEDEDMFTELLNEINDVTLVRLKAATNYADGKEKLLSLEIGSSQIECNVPVVRSISDNEAPMVKELYYDLESDAFMISFTEKVVGATSPGSYRITDSKGNKFNVSDIFYLENKDIYEIKTKEQIKKGTYTFEFSGIKDDSKEANLIAEKKSIVVEKAKVGSGLPVWAIIIIVVGSVVIIAVITLLFVLFSKKNAPTSSNEPSFEVPVRRNVPQMVDFLEPQYDEVKHHIKANDVTRIRLKIKTGRTSEQNIETNLVSSIIVGRSDTCDIYIDDAKLSRQHFVIENDNGDFYVMDLQSRNGTMLNGIRINSRHPLKSGDKIFAGLSDIIITIIGR